ncbi:MAG: alpha/beta hydrolase [Polyangiales bacterium]
MSAALARTLLRPPAVIVKRTTRNRWEVDGERLDPAMQHVFAMAKIVQRSMPAMGHVRARRYYEMMCKILDEPPIEVFQTRDLQFETRAGVRAARAYYPCPGEKAPCLVYIHGGGHTIGSIRTHDAFCRRLAVASECVVVSIDYRLAPEDPFPAAPEDCYDVYLSLLDRSQELRIDPARVAVGGDSAGGNLSTTVAAMVRESGAPAPRLQLLIYPAVGGINHEGRQNPGLQRHYGLDAETTHWFTEKYVQDADYRDPGVAPLYLDTHQGLPPAVIVTAHFDLLCREGLEYVQVLESAGVPVTHLHYRDLPHGFATMSCVPRARAAIEEIGATLGAHLSACD